MLITCIYLSFLKLNCLIMALFNGAFRVRRPQTNPPCYNGLKDNNASKVTGKSPDVDLNTI